MSEDDEDRDRGYEPEGNAGTSSASHASQSGHFSTPRSRGPSATRPFEVRKVSDHRISTVPEGDEEELSAEEEAVLGNQFEHNELLSTPTRADIARGNSAPLNTPPQTHVPPISLSNDNTPTSPITPKTDKSKKHKSSSSTGWIPKISRWSETTVSTVAKGFRSNRSSKQKEQMNHSPPLRSQSALDTYDSLHDPYGDDKLPQGSAEAFRFQSEQVAPPTPQPQLQSPEDFKYKAHRNSLNLLHPQPRPGPTVRYQTALEHQADSFPQAPSVKSLEWGSSTSLSRLPPNANRYANATPVSDAGYTSSAAAPARPPKEPIEDSQARSTPRRNRLSKQQQPPSITLSDRSLSPESTHGYVMSGGGGGYEAGSPRAAGVRLSSGLGVPAQKPIGPRVMSGSNWNGGGGGGANLQGDTGTVIRREKRDTFGGGEVHEGSLRSFSGESETF